MSAIVSRPPSLRRFPLSCADANALPTEASTRIAILKRNLRPGELLMRRPCGTILRLRRVTAFSVYAQLGQRLLRLCGVELAVASQLGECCRDHRFRIHFKMPAQMLAVIAAPKPVRPQRNQPVKQPGSKQIG